MQDEYWNEVSGSGVEPWETPKPKRSKSWLVALIAAVVVAAAGAAAYLALGPWKSADKLLSAAWEKTAERWEARMADQPLRAMSAALEDGQGSAMELELRDLQADGETLLDRLSLDGAGGEDNVWMRLAAEIPGMDPLDAAFSVTQETFGLGSEALLGDDTLYTVPLGGMAQAAKGSIFDPDSGTYPLDRQSLEELDRLFSDSRAGLDTKAMQEDLEAAAEEAKARYETFVRSVDGKKSRDGGKTILTYVYPADEAIDMVEDVLDLFLDTEFFTAYFNQLEAMSTGLTLSDARASLREGFDDLRENYEGDVTVTYTLDDGCVARVELACSPTYDGESIDMTVDVDLSGLEESGGKARAKVLLVNDSGSELRFALTCAPTVQGELSEDSWTLEAEMDGTSLFQCEGSSSWDRNSGALESRLVLSGDGAEQLRLEGQGALAVDQSSFALEYDNLSIAAGGSSVSCGLRLHCDSGAGAAAPAGRTKDLFSLTEAEFEALLNGAAMRMGALTGELDGLEAIGGPDGPAAIDPAPADDDTPWDPSEPASPESVKAPVAPGYHQLGVTTLCGEDVYVPAEVESMYGDSNMLCFATGNVYFTVYVYPDYGDSARYNLELDTESWDTLSDGSMEVGELRDSGDKAGRWMRGAGNATAHFVEMRGETAVFTDIDIMTATLTEDDIELLKELDWALAMPVQLADLLP